MENPKPTAEGVVEDPVDRGLGQGLRHDGVEAGGVPVDQNPVDQNLGEVAVGRRSGCPP